jgi:hypothetical protein
MGIHNCKSGDILWCAPCFQPRVGLDLERSSTFGCLDTMWTREAKAIVWRNYGTLNYYAVALRRANSKITSLRTFTPL